MRILEIKKKKDKYIFLNQQFLRWTPEAAVALFWDETITFIEMANNNILKDNMIKDVTEVKRLKSNALLLPESCSEGLDFTEILFSPQQYKNILFV